MPQNARIHQTDVTADYANTVLWEAGEEGSDYGSVTVGIQEDLYSPSGGLRMDGTWVNSFQLIAKVGEEANASDITQGAGFIAGAGQFIDIRVPNGEFKNIRIEGTFLRIIGTSTNTKLTNCVSRGVIQDNVANDIVLDNTLFLSDGVADTIAVRDTPATLSNSTVISLNDTGGHVVRSRGSAVVASNDSVCFAPNTATSFLAFIGGTFTGNYNAGHTGGSTPGANSVTNLTRTVNDVFTDPANNDYTPKVGGPLDGASSTGGFIGAFAPVASGITVTPSTINSASASNNPVIAFNSVVNLTPNAIDSLSIANNPSIQFGSALNISPATIDSVSASNDPIVSFSAVLNITPQTIDSVSATNNPSILFNSVLSLTPSTIDSLSVSNDPAIEFKSVINVLPQTIDSLSVSRNPFISFGVVQTIGNVTASFKDSGISVKYEEDEINVGYKPNAITVNFK